MTRALFWTIAALFTALATSLPLVERAGAPSIQPIPSNCTISSSLPTSPDGHTTYMPSKAFMKNLVYQAYFNDPEERPADETKQCFEQCYSFGNDECKSAMLAYRIPTPKGYHGAKGGKPATGCLMFGEFLGKADWVKAPMGAWIDARQGNLRCPGARMEDVK